MLPMAPYNTWPLHVKIFTEEAKKLWDEVQQPGLDTPLPRGFTYSVEYEGVDGKASVSAVQKSKARAGPIDVKDAQFTLSHIDKYQTILEQGIALSCSVCCKNVAGKRMSFRGSAPGPSLPLIPRGGVCKGCDKYVLWGDVIRGCYRRARGGLEKPASDEEVEEEDGEEETEEARTEDSDNDLAKQLDGLRINEQHPTRPQPPQPRPQNRSIPSMKQSRPAKQPKPQAAPKPKPKLKPRRVLYDKQNVPPSDVEDFAAEMDAIQCDTEDDDAPPSKVAPKPPLKTKRALETQNQNTKTVGVGVSKPSGDDSRLSDIDRALEGLSLFPKGKGVLSLAPESSEAMAPRSKPIAAKGVETTRPTKTKRTKRTDAFDDAGGRKPQVAKSLVREAHRPNISIFGEYELKDTEFAVVA
ncbi:Slx4p interacting protein, partial [Ceratobasidium sp. 392]